MKKIILHLGVLLLLLLPANFKIRPYSLIWLTQF